MKEKEISTEVLEEISHRFALCGERLISKLCPDKVVGWSDKGYLRLKVKGKIFYQHRVVWFLTTGLWPSGILDHINGIKSDNRFENLRLASNKENLMNSPQRAGKKLPRGVFWNSSRGKFRAILCVEGVNKHLGYFTSVFDARQAYLEAAKNIYGDFVYE